MTMTTVIDVAAIFAALEKWINQRPRLDKANYGCAPGQARERGEWGRAYRAYTREIRSIGEDKRRAVKALEEARSLTPAKPELLVDAFKRAFSGRLEWVGHLEYTTGQYWPTEYRKAAASVMECYVATWKQWWAAEHPGTFTYETIEDVKAANRQIGNHWFDRSTIRFFNTRIESPLIGGRYFITSERCDENRPRKYTVRRADPDGTIDTVGEFQQYYDKADARQAIREALKG